VKGHATGQTARMAASEVHKAAGHGLRDSKPSGGVQATLCLVVLTSSVQMPYFRAQTKLNMQCRLFRLQYTNSDTEP
jgi:hypothetical protein